MPQTRAVRAERAQASVEYTSLLLLLAVLLLACVALVPGVRDAVVAAVRTTVCQLAGGHGCGATTAARPCVVASSVRRTSASLGIPAVRAVAKLAGGNSVLREDLSDGTARITLVDDGGVAAEIMTGLGTTSLSASASAAAGGKLAGASVYEFQSARQADAFERGLRASGHPAGVIRDLDSVASNANPLTVVTGFDPVEEALDRVGVPKDDPRPSPDARYLEGRVSEQLTGSLAATAGTKKVDPKLSAVLESAPGARVYTSGERRGQAEVFVRVDGQASGELGRVLLGGTGKGSGVATLDLASAGGLHAKALRLSLSGAALKGAGGRASGRRTDTQVELDLTEPVNRAAALALLDPRTPDPIEAARALYRRIRDHGRVTVQTFGVRSQTKALDLGAKGVGFHGEEGSESARSRELYVREPGGAFVRAECAARV